MDEYIAVYGKRLYGLCMTLCASREDADDLYQETWLKALRKIRTYDSAMPFEPWITKICVNTYRDVLRKKIREPVFDSFDTVQEKDNALESVPEKEKDNMDHIREAVDRLPEKLRMTVILFYFHDMGEKRTAKALKVPVGTVKSRLNKAKKILREEIKDAEFI